MVSPTIAVYLACWPINLSVFIPYFAVYIRNVLAAPVLPEATATARAQLRMTAETLLMLLTILTVLANANVGEVV